MVPQGLSGDRDSCPHLALSTITPMVERYRSWFKPVRLRGDASFANPEIYEYCKEQRLTYFIRLPANGNLMRLIEPHLHRPVGRPPKCGVQIKVVDLQYQAKSCHKPRMNISNIILWTYIWQNTIIK